MKLASLFPALLILAATSPALADFCTDPYGAICGDPALVKQRRNENIERFRKKMAEHRAKHDALDTGTQCENEANPIGQIARGLLGGYLRLTNTADPEVAELENTAALENADRIKGLLKDAIDEEVGPLTLDPAVVARMKEKIDRVKIFTPAMLAGKGGLSLGLLSYHLTCGLDGMENNAYALTNDPDHPSILLCPGWLASAQGSGQDATANFLNVVQVIGHELGHHIDASVYPELFAPYEACLASETGSQLEFGRKSYQKAMSAASHLYTPLKLYPVKRHEREITADYWAAQTVRQYLKTIEPAQRLGAIEQAWSGLCDSKDEGVHPTGRYRIEVILRGDPGIQQLMGCPARRGTCELFPGRKHLYMQFLSDSVARIQDRRHDQGK